MRATRYLLACALACPLLAAAQLAPAENMVRYPALYSSLTLSYHPQEKSFDANGDEQTGATPTYGANSAFPTSQQTLALEWFFPFFETTDFPPFSDRLWTAKAQLGLLQTRSKGGVAAFADANGLSRQGDGVQDLQLEFGPVLLGSQNWRTRSSTPYSLTALGRVQLPLGSRDANAPNNAGSNVYGFGFGLKGYWRAHPRVHVDASAAADTYSSDDEPAFGAQTPAQVGNKLAAALSVSSRIYREVYLNAGLDTWRRTPNRYEQVRFAANPPEPDLGMDSFPDPSLIEDQGARLTQAAFGLSWFIAPRLRVDATWHHPLSGKSGAFDLSFLQQPMRCAATETPISDPACNPERYGSAQVDGLGNSARAYADDHYSLRIAYQWQQGDFFLGR